MRLINKTKDTVLAEDVLIADTVLKRIKGLLGKKTFSQGQAMIIYPCNSIHTFFMKFPIDVIFADKNYKIVKTLDKFKPNTFSQIYWTSHKVIELPSGTLESTKSQIGDQLQII